MPYVERGMGAGRNCFMIYGRYDPTMLPELTRQMLDSSAATAPRRVPSRSTAAITPSNWPRSPTSPATACFPSSVQPLPKYDYPSPAWIRIPPSLNYSAGVYGGVVRVEGKVLLEVCLELAQKKEFLPLLFHCADQGCK